MISKKTIYGLQAAILLAKRHNTGPVLITQLAQEGHIPKKFLEAILLELRKRRILDSKKGKGGGYVLAKSPQQISIGEIVRTLEGSLSDIYMENDTKEIQEIRSLMKELREAISNLLDKTTLADVIDRTCSGQHVLNFVI